jgi:hypothetical protein
MRSICLEVAGQLEEAAKADDEEELPQLEAKNAPQRFADAIQASLSAAKLANPSLDPAAG